MEKKKSAWREKKERWTVVGQGFTEMLRGLKVGIIATAVGIVMGFLGAMAQWLPLLYMALLEILVGGMVSMILNFRGMWMARPAHPGYSRHFTLRTVCVGLSLLRFAMCNERLLKWMALPDGALELFTGVGTVLGLILSALSLLAAYCFYTANRDILAQRGQEMLVSRARGLWRWTLGQTALAVLKLAVGMAQPTAQALIWLNWLMRVADMVAAIGYMVLMWRLLRDGAKALLA